MARKQLGAAPSGTKDVTTKTYVDNRTGCWTASDNGFISWACDPSLITAGTLMASSGLVYVVRLPIRAATTITNVLLYVATSGSGLVANQCLAGLYQGGTLLSTTADQSTSWNSTGLKTMALGSAQAVTAGTVQVAFFANQSAGAMPTLARAANFAAGIANLGVGTAYRFASADTGRTTSLPATLGTMTSSAIAFWAAVS